MAIVGKLWSAVLAKTYTLTPPQNEDGSTWILYYDQFRTSEEELQTYYPDLCDLAKEFSTNYGIAGLRSNFLQQNSPPNGNYEGEGDNLVFDPDGDEAAMVDTAAQDDFYKEGANATAAYFMWWSGSGWLSGSFGLELPDVIWGRYPDNETYAETDDAPFGTGLGAGTIRYQVITWTPDSGTTFIQTEPATPPTPAAPTEFPFSGVEALACDLYYIFTPVDDGSPPIDPEPGPPGVVDDDVRVRVWGFKLDGHTYYNLRLGDEGGTHTFDLTTGQWAEWQTPGETRWRPHVGCNWVGMAGTINLGGSDIVCGDDTTGTLWVVDPDTFTDDNAVSGLPQSFDRVVTGGIPLNGREVAPCNAVTMNLSLGSPSISGALITLETSDDMGRNYVNHGSIEIEADAFDQVIEWRSLGLMKQPGRVFRFTDNGVAVRISSADLR